MERRANIKVDCCTKDASETEVNCLGTGSQSVVPANHTPLSSGEDEGYQTRMVFGSFEPETLARYGIVAIDPEEWRKQISHRRFIVGKRSAHVLGNRKISKKKSASARRSPGLQNSVSKRRGDW
jgi:hypothetical protein